MVQGFYSLDEAARVLGVAPDELNQMAQRREIRAFADRGTWRFRTQDVEELARRRGAGSNPDLQLGDAKAPAKPAGPEDSEVFTFSLGADDDERIEIGQELGRESGSQKSSSKHGRGPTSPAPKPGSDSDVRLVPEGSDVTFALAGESDVRPVKEPKAGKGKAKSKSDSDVKLVQETGPADSAVPIGVQGAKGGTDSDIRLEEPSGGSGIRSAASGGDDSMLTEEIDLDSELARAEESARSKKKPKAKKDFTDIESTSPFEISDSDLEKPVAKAKKKPESSSDFDLKPAKPGDSSPISISSSEMKALPDDSEEVTLGGSPKGLAGASSDSGINLAGPDDSGISLEQGAGDGSEEIEFEVSLDPESTPKPKPKAQEDDSSSEFELTLDDSGGLAPIEEEAPAASGGDKDIFETDFDVPALEDESGSQAVALGDSDTDLESSDFDLALGEEDASSDEESGSQVVVLEDEEEVDEGAATVARTSRRPARGAAALDSGETEPLDDISAEEEPVSEEEELAPRRVTASADWGYLPAGFLIPGAVVLLLVAMMGFELLHGMWGYRQPGKVSGLVVRGLSDMFGAELPKD